MSKTDDAQVKYVVNMALAIIKNGCLYLRDTMNVPKQFKLYTFQECVRRINIPQPYLLGPFLKQNVLGYSIISLLY